EPKYLHCVIGTDDGAKPHRQRVRLRNHDTQATGKHANHEVTFGPTIQNTVTDLLNNSNAVVRINDFVADLVIHSLGCPPRSQDQCTGVCRKSQDIPSGIREIAGVRFEFGKRIALPFGLITGNYRVSYSSFSLKPQGLSPFPPL